MNDRHGPRGVTNLHAHLELTDEVFHGYMGYEIALPAKAPPLTSPTLLRATSPITHSFHLILSNGAHSFFWLAAGSFQIFLT